MRDEEGHKLATCLSREAYHLCGARFAETSLRVLDSDVLDIHS